MVIKNAPPSPDFRGFFPQQPAYNSKIISTPMKGKLNS